MAEKNEGSATLPSWLQRLLALVLTFVALACYAGILGTAIVRTFLEDTPAFGVGLLRAAELLSGLVGAVVAAGFGRGRRSFAAPISAAHALGGRAVTGWTSLKPPSLAQSKLSGLAEMLGLQRRAVRGAPTSHRDPGAPDPIPAPTQGLTLTQWVAFAYVIVYLVLGAAACLLWVVRSGGVPALIASAGTVWLGTVITTVYSFFALGQLTQ